MPDLASRLYLWGLPVQEPEEIGMPYQIKRVDTIWNKIRSETGTLLYWANRHSKQIFRVSAGYVSGPIGLFMGDNVTEQFKEEEIEELCG